MSDNITHAAVYYLDGCAKACKDFFDKSELFSIACFILAAKIIETDTKYPTFEEISQLTGHLDKEGIYKIEREII